MAKVRPNGFVNLDTVMKVIERSIESATEWSLKTNEVFYNLEERIQELNELLDIVVELHWRYGNVQYKFTAKAKIENATVIDCIESEHWAKRILVDENERCPKVYIRF